MIYVVAFCILGMAVFGSLWLSTVRQLHKVETERDRLWDACYKAAPLIAGGYRPGGVIQKIEGPR